MANEFGNKRDGYTYVVVGRGEFPIDMLRYDAAYPARQDDVRAIEATFRARQPGVADNIGIRLRSLHHGPTIGRWESFGFRVEAVR